jgi:peptide/nickel transport system permease protein
VQYWHFIVNMFTLDAGTSLQFQIPVWEYVKMRIFNTFILAAPALTVAYILGGLFGTILGYYNNSKLEEYGLIPIIAVGSFPEFFLSIVLLITLASWLGIFPISGMVSPDTMSDASQWYDIYLTADFLWHYILPFGTIVLRYLFIPSLIMRTSVVETMGKDFSFYNRMTGMPKAERMANIAKHASLPVITVYPATMTRAIGGLVLVETVFNWPGIGYALVNSVLARDFPVVQFVFVVIAAFVIFANFAVDVLYARIDPRVAVDQ